MIDDPNKAPQVVDKGLGIINFAPIPHWGVEEFQRGLKDIKNKLENENVETITIKDNEAVFVEDSRVEKI